MTKKLISLCLIGFVLLGLAGGCGSAGKVELDKDYMATAEAQGKDKRAIFERANGDYNAMSSEDRTKFLSYFSNEEDAKKFWELMAHPPSSQAGPVGTNPTPSAGGQ